MKRHLIYLLVALCGLLGSCHTKLPVNTGLPMLSEGVITLKPDTIRTFRLLNEDGSVWKQIVFNDGFSDSLLLPYASKPENWLLVFRCIQKEHDRYKVIVNEETSNIKYISSNDSNFVAQSWEENMLQSTFIGFDVKTNPLKESPQASAANVPYAPDEEEDVFFRAVKIEGDWVQVKSNDDQVIGWIRWKNEKGEMLVDVFYDA
ncbi:hypothetical protein FHW36_1011325 [Chitinophaga polysaccharea]|uniref:Uncharacterized protein n=1 Tax=Chitinophaga polysaccharea TaxID=1293035 RepID=A0A561Q4U8_9BACT|nr:hypothetical protein [Chitinophaga polysaccharea]TWF45395.1 hypothetical protein FHW36_1011325 [Chitinophaga polysaccharea]